VAVTGGKVLGGFRYLDVVVTKQIGFNYFSFEIFSGIPAILIAEYFVLLLGEIFPQSHKNPQLYLRWKLQKVLFTRMGFLIPRYMALLLVLSQLKLAKDFIVMPKNYFCKCCARQNEQYLSNDWDCNNLANQ